MHIVQLRVDAARQEAFAAGYAAAMKKVKELTRRRAASDGGAAAVPIPNGRGSGRDRRSTRQAAATSRPVRRRRSPRTNGIAAGPARRPRRRTNAVSVSAVLNSSAAPRAFGQAEIRRALQEKRKTMSFPSIGYSLRQLVAHNAARQVGSSKTWRSKA